MKEVFGISRFAVHLGHTDDGTSRLILNTFRKSVEQNLDTNPNQTYEM